MLIRFLFISTMVKSCSAFNCTNRAVKDTGLSFYRFPVDEKRRQEWVHALKRKNFVPTDNSRLCSVHFSSDSYTSNKCGTKKLKADAVPTIFDFPTHLRTKKKALDFDPAFLVEECLISHDEKDMILYSNNEGHASQEDHEHLVDEACQTDKDMKPELSILTSVRLRKKVKILQQQLKRRDAKICTMANLIAVLKKKDNLVTSKPAFKMAEPLSSRSNTSFVGKVDRYKGVHIKSAPCDVSSLKSKLELSLEEWKSQEMRAVWCYVSLKDAHWVPVLAENDFRFHHTQGDEVAMVRWLAPEESRIPVFAHTLVGAGAVVLNSEGKLLVVQERYGNVAYWKLPGGYVEPGENISEAAMREVMEETNIKTEFRTMIAFRHTHGAPFGCSDIYFIVELAPLTTDIVKDQLEIEDCQWMEIETYLNHPNVHENNRLFLRKYLFSKEKGISINGEKTLHPITKAPQMLFGLGPRE